MAKHRSRALVVACVGLVFTSAALGLVLLLAVAIPRRGTDPVDAAVALLLAVVAFVVAGVGVALVALRRRTGR
jgi:hypothetical protein